MGMLAAFDATGKGKLGKESIKWAINGFMGGFSSPVLDGDRIYQADNGGNLFAFDANTGSEMGKFYIIRPHADKAEMLSEVEMPISNLGLASEKVPEPILAGAAV